MATAAPRIRIPVYIDTNALLDLLAALEDGFSFVEKVSTQRQSSAGNETRVGGEFGISNVLSLLRIGVRGDASSRRSDEESHNAESERTHTYGSLLHRLRARLEADGQVRPVASVGDFAQVEVFDFVEVSGQIRLNPLQEWLQRVLQALETAKLAAGPGQPGKRAAGPKQPARGAASDKQELEQIRKFLERLLEELAGTDVRLFLIDLGGASPGQCIMILYLDYLRDKTMAEITQGQFSVLAKVVRKTDAGDEPISLISGSVLGTLGDETLNGFITALEATSESGLRLPDVAMSIPAPAIHLAPIAIYA